LHSNRLTQLARKPVSAGVIALAIVSVTTQMIALAAVTGWSNSHGVKSSMAATVIHNVQCGGPAATRPSACPTPSTTEAKMATGSRERVVVPSGAAHCPESGPGAACVNHAVTSDTGNSATPDGMTACPTEPSKPVKAPGSCDLGAAGTPAQPAPATPDNHSAAASPAGGSSHSPNPKSAPDAVMLSSSSTSLTAGGVIFLTAHSTLDVTGTPYAIEIFDTTTETLVAACTQGTDCMVSFSARSGHHDFVAYVVRATQSMPHGDVKLKSDKVDVRFLGVSLQVVQPSIVAPGKAVTFVANATEDVGKTGFVIEISDASTGQRLTFCRYGTTCSMSLVEPAGGVHPIIATLGAADNAVLNANPDVHAASALVTAVWLSVQLDAATGSPVQNNTVTVSATANADLSQTPYSIYLFDQSGNQLGNACNAASCSATAPLQGGNQSFSAVIGRVPMVGSGSGPLASVIHRLPTSRDRLDVQAVSASVKPTHMLWGVDSCQPITDLLGQVNAQVGHPDVWARYLPNTGNCGGLTGAEIAAAHSQHIGILPIFNDYDCSAVSGYATGAGYAHQAVQWMENDMIPPGVAIAVDIEPVGPGCAANVDQGFIQGWYDVIKQSRFVPAYYGNTSAGSAFANAWCTAVGYRPEIALNSYLWSFEPSLGGGYSKGNAPHFNPYSAGCAGHYLAWQYQLSSGGSPNIDQDEVSSDFPIWYP
jgi:hypothetical protein